MKSAHTFYFDTRDEVHVSELKRLADGRIKVLIKSCGAQVILAVDDTIELKAIAQEILFQAKEYERITEAAQKRVSPRLNPHDLPDSARAASKE